MHVYKGLEAIYIAEDCHNSACDLVRYGRDSVETERERAFANANKGPNASALAP